MATTTALEQFRRADAASAPVAKCILDDAIFTGVIRYYRDRASRQQPIPQQRKRNRKRSYLVIHRYPHSLKDAREIARSATWAKHRADGSNQVFACSERFVGPPPDNFIGHPPCLWLITIVSQNIGEIFSRNGIDKVGRCWSL